MKKTYIIVIAILLMTGMLLAQERHVGHCPDGRGEKQERCEKKPNEGMILKHMAEELELTESQIEAMHELQMNHKKFMIQIKADIELLQLDKQAAMKAKDFTEARWITEKIFEKKELIAQEKINLKEARWNLLTADQKQKAEDMKMHHPPKMCDKMKGEHKM